jgi:hypothetical protein
MGRVASALHAVTATGVELNEILDIYHGIPAEQRPGGTYEQDPAPWRALWAAFAARDRALAARIAVTDEALAQRFLDRADNWSRLVASERRDHGTPNDAELVAAGRRVVRMLRDGRERRIEEVIDLCCDTFGLNEQAVRWALGRLLKAGMIATYAPGVVRAEPGVKLVAPTPASLRSQATTNATPSRYDRFSRTAIGVVDG